MKKILLKKLYQKFIKNLNRLYMSDKKEDTLPPGHKLVADDGSGVESNIKVQKIKMENI